MDRARRMALAALLLAGASFVPAAAAGAPPAPPTFQLGITVEHVPDGLLVNDVQPGSPSGKAGLVVGDLIVSMDGRKAKALTPEQIEAAFSASYTAPIAFVVRRSGGKIDISVGP